MVIVPADSTLDILKEKVGEEIVTNYGPAPYRQRPLSALIQRSEWGFHSTQRAVPFNMPVTSLRQSDLPLKFSWHEWSDSYQEHGELWEEQIWGASE